ncbi:hypothetical protein MLD38_039689 [Melastoma candidum]|uniref:Uncharacterized protein n=1 Tax=Melastoma candidum TaxID=119954 RepID=A0ACB9L593_9MYRT|nr:hypothetical protein MLD38_039689 [Melastoma candidum]
MGFRIVFSHHKKGIGDVLRHGGRRRRRRNPTLFRSGQHIVRYFTFSLLIIPEVEDFQVQAMPRYYCDYCDTYLTHDSPSVRKQHNAGYKHKANVRLYYQQFEEQQTQSIIDQRIKEHLGQAAAFQQVGAAYNQLMAQGPRLPVLPTPVMPMPPNMQLPMNSPFIPGMRPPVLPRPPPGAPAFAPISGAPPGVAPPGAPSMPPMNGLPRPPTMFPPTVPGGPGMSAASSGGMPAMSAPVYQSNPAPMTSNLDGYNSSSKDPEDDD